MFMRRIVSPGSGTDCGDSGKGNLLRMSPFNFPFPGLC